MTDTITARRLAAKAELRLQKVRTPHGGWRLIDENNHVVAGGELGIDLDQVEIELHARAS